MSLIRLPKALPARPTVRVVHPAGSTKGHLERLTRGLEYLEAFGCEVRWDSVRAQSLWREYYAGSDDERADEFIKALNEPDVDIIWFARGGSGCGRIVPRICESAAHVAPKIIIGFSDATSLLNALAQHLGWVTYHGPVVTSLGDESLECRLDQYFSILSGQTKSVEIPKANEGPLWSGRLFGGNLSVLASRVGTQYGIVAKPESIWLIEDVGESPYRLERCFWQLFDAGIFAGARGIWCGDLDMPSVHNEKVASYFGVDARLLVRTGAPIGHKCSQALCPIGLPVHVDPVSGLLASETAWVDA